MKGLFKLGFGLVAFLCMSMTAWSQVSNVSGNVKDQASLAIPYAMVEIYTQGDTPQLVDGGMSDEEGNFTVENIAFGKYDLVISAVGFAEKVIAIEINQSPFVVDNIILGSDMIELQGVEIRAETSQYRTEIDKRVVDVGKDLVSAGADAAAVLNNIPSVSVDPQSGQLSLRGNENVKVLVDGKPSNIPVDQLLKQLPSNAIAKIEIITNPSAKYEPEGNSGIINIITHKNKRKGYNMSVNLGSTYGEYLKTNGSINANLNTGNFNFFGNYNESIGKNRSHGIIQNYTTKLDQFFDNVSNNKAHVFKVGMDWFISDKSELTIYTSQYYHNGDGWADTNVLDNNTNTLFKNFNDDKNKYQNQDYSLNFKQNFDKENHHIILDAIYSNSKHNDNRNYVYNYPVDNFSDSRSGENTSIRVNLDYTNQIIDAGKIEAGLQYRESENINDLISNQEFLTDTGTTYNPFVNFDFTRKIYAAYMNYGQTFGKFSMQLGLRVEQVEENAIFTIAPTTDDDYKNEYFELYPSAFFTYQITDRGQLSLNYSRRIDRPHLGQISPVPEWSISTIVSEGNPNIKPQFTNSFELGFLQSFKGGSVNAVVFYRKIDDLIFRFIDKHPNNENVVLQKYVNYDSSNSYGLELSANYRPFKWWSTNASFDIFANEFFYNNETKLAKPWSTRVNNNFTLTKSLSLQNFFMYRGPYEFIQGKMEPMWKMDLGARYTFMEGKATLSARVSDIFKTFYSVGLIENVVPGRAKFEWESQTFYLGFSYTFGGDVRKRNLKQDTGGSGSAGGGGIGF